LALQIAEVANEMRRIGKINLRLIDMRKHKQENRPGRIIQNWLRNLNTIEFLGLWERLNNALFKHLEFEVSKKSARLIP